jgi:hypothetical protein
MKRLQAMVGSSAVTLAVCFAIGCGGGVATEAAVKDSPRDPQAPTSQPSASAPSASSSASTKPGDAPCEKPAPVVVASGGTITRPTGSALRLQLVYQGAAIGVTQVRGVDMVLPPADGPFAAGKVSGYWVESRSATAPLYQHLFRDPTVREAPPPPGPGGGGFSNSTIDRCEPKIILADVPNDPAATELRIYGSPYGTVEAAVELARFKLK